MTDIHTVAECSKKLVVLLDKIKGLPSTNNTNAALLGHEISDIKALAREVDNESEFVAGIR